MSFLTVKIFHKGMSIIQSDISGSLWKLDAIPCIASIRQFGTFKFAGGKTFKQLHEEEPLVFHLYSNYDRGLNGFDKFVIGNEVHNFTKFKFDDELSFQKAYISFLRKTFLKDYINKYIKYNQTNKRYYVQLSSSDNSSWATFITSIWRNINENAQIGLHTLKILNQAINAKIAITADEAFLLGHWINDIQNPNIKTLYGPDIIVGHAVFLYNCQHGIANDIDRIINDLLMSKSNIFVHSDRPQEIIERAKSSLKQNKYSFKDINALLNYIRGK